MPAYGDIWYHDIFFDIIIDIKFTNMKFWDFDIIIVFWYCQMIDDISDFDII